MKKQIPLLVAIAALMFSSLACRLADQTINPIPTLAPLPVPTQDSAIAPVTPQSVDLSQEQDALVSLYQRVEPGIVSIQIVTQNGSALGSGFVFDTDGHIVTNQHVVDGADQIEVSFDSGYKAYAKLIGIDQDSDLAVIKVDVPASELHPLTMGDSSKLQVGQTVVAIGNPFGLSGTMTKGIISALGRTLGSNRQTQGGGYFGAGGIIQTDAAINPGNSGGPLFNINGEVIGVNRAIVTDASNSSGEPVNSGIGFAIASNIVRRVVPVIIKDGVYNYPYLGVSTRDLAELPIDAIKALGFDRFTGIYVMDVVAGGPADKAGVKAATTPTNPQDLPLGGDLIIAIDGNAIETYSDLITYLFTSKSPGDVAVLTVLRDGKSVDVTVTLGKRP